MQHGCLNSDQPEPLSRYEVIQRDRAMARLELGRALAERIIRKLAKMGVTSELFGSMQTGDVFPESDVDILITARNNVSHGEIIHEVGLLLEGIPADVVFLEHVPPYAVPQINSSRAAL